MMDGDPLVGEKQARPHSRSSGSWASLLFIFAGLAVLLVWWVLTPRVAVVYILGPGDQDSANFDLFSRQMESTSKLVDLYMVYVGDSQPQEMPMRVVGEFGVSAASPCEYVCLWGTVMGRVSTGYRSVVFLSSAVRGPLTASGIDWVDVFALQPMSSRVQAVTAVPECEAGTRPLFDFHAWAVAGDLARDLLANNFFSCSASNDVRRELLSDALVARGTSMSSMVPVPEVCEERMSLEYGHFSPSQALFTMASSPRPRPRLVRKRAGEDDPYAVATCDGYVCTAVGLTPNITNAERVCAGECTDEECCRPREDAVVIPPEVDSTAIGFDAAVGLISGSAIFVFLFIVLCCFCVAVKIGRMPNVTKNEEYQTVLQKMTGRYNEEKAAAP